MADKIIGSGAEATLFLSSEGTLKKVRAKKNYRISEIDDELIKTRTRREKKVLEKLPVNSPKLISFTDDTIEMEFIDGTVFKNVFSVDYCEQIGEMIAKMHDVDIIHGDLTTSNMILKDSEVYFIDFGLSFFSKKVEDKAVDLHLLYHALESKHYKEFEKAFEKVLEGYKKSPNYDEVIERFEIVEKRGRNKH